MNWGKGMVIVLAVFMALIITMAVLMFTAPVDDYDHQYYEKGLTFNHDYDSETQVYKDHATPLVQQNGEAVKLTFAQPVTIGTVTFSRPSDSRMDKTITLQTNAGNEMTIPAAGIANGKWQLVFAWESNHKKYLYRQALYLK